MFNSGHIYYSYWRHNNIMLHLLLLSFGTLFFFFIIQFFYPFSSHWNITFPLLSAVSIMPQPPYERQPQPPVISFDIYVCKKAFPREERHVDIVRWGSNVPNSIYPKKSDNLSCMSKRIFFMIFQMTFKYVLIYIYASCKIKWYLIDIFSETRGDVYRSLDMAFWETVKSFQEIDEIIKIIFYKEKKLCKCLSNTIYRLDMINSI